MMKRTLLFSVTKKDLEISYFSGTGAGGQYRNRHKNCVRIKHPDSGVIVTGQEERSLRQNLRNAFNRLVNHPQFKKWLRLESARIAIKGPSIDELVEEAMRPENLKIEYGKVY